MTAVLYVLKRFPRLSETFVLHELLRLQDAGLMLGVDSLRVPEDQPRHPELATSGTHQWGFPTDREADREAEREREREKKGEHQIQ